MAGQATATDYEYRVNIPGQVNIPELGLTIQILQLSAGDAAGYNPDQLFDAKLLPRELKIRNWRPGDRFWPAHTKAPKKIKELLQERHISGAARKLWPVVDGVDEVIWIRGFSVPARFRPQAETIEVAVIRELSQE